MHPPYPFAEWLESVKQMPGLRASDEELRRIYDERVRMAAAEVRDARRFGRTQRRLENQIRLALRALHRAEQEYAAHNATCDHPPDQCVPRPALDLVTDRTGQSLRKYCGLCLAIL